jgi:hypothetical protein
MSRLQWMRLMNERPHERRNPPERWATQPRSLVKQQAVAKKKLAKMNRAVWDDTDKSNQLSVYRVLY